MNYITAHRINRLFITAIIACLLPAAVFGQEMRKETLKGSATPYAVFYSTGMPTDAIWPIGMKMTGDYATIRHTVEKGNGDNLSVNDKVPFRFIIAPTDGVPTNSSDTRYWAAAMGFNTGTGGANTNLNPGWTSSYVQAGCLDYYTTEFPKETWRLPTQRELMLMWLFRDAINAIYPSGQMTSTRSYWCATEKDATNAWLLEYNETSPQFKPVSKVTGSIYFRCVKDY